MLILYSSTLYVLLELLYPVKNVEYCPSSDWMTGERLFEARRSRICIPVVLTLVSDSVLIEANFYNGGKVWIFGPRTMYSPIYKNYLQLHLI